MTTEMLEHIPLPYLPYGVKLRPNDQIRDVQPVNGQFVVTVARGVGGEAEQDTVSEVHTEAGE